MSISYTTWLSVKEWIGEVIGHPILALFIALAAFNYMAVKNDVPFKATLVMNILIGFVFVGVVYSVGVLIIIAMVTAFIIYGAYSIFWRN